MKPYYQDEAVTIYHADCGDVLPLLEPNSIDLVLTDPPYGIREDDWDNMDMWEFARFSMAWLAEARRISQSLLVFCVPTNSIRQLCEMLYPTLRQIIWSKPIGSQYNGASEARLWFAHEVILHGHSETEWVKPKNLTFARLLREARERAGISRGAIDMAVRGKKTGLCYRWEEAACIPTVEQINMLRGILELSLEFDDAIKQAITDKAETADKADVLEHRTVPNPLHPCEKPEGLIKDLLLTVGNKAQTILDPFMGSGTTLRAAKDLGRKAIGIEIDEHYCELAAKRMAQTVMEL